MPKRLRRHERARERLLRSFVVEALTRDLAERAGCVIGNVAGISPDKGTIDAIVLTSAWLRGDTVYTSDLGELGRTYRRYLENTIRGRFEFLGTPIRIELRGSRE